MLVRSRPWLRHSLLSRVKTDLAKGSSIFTLNRQVPAPMMPHGWPPYIAEQGHRLAHQNGGISPPQEH